MKKLFMGAGECPYKPGTEIGGQVCRKCSHYFNTPPYALYILCNHPDEPKQGNSVPKQAQSVPKVSKPVSKAAGTDTNKKRRGRPQKNADSKPNKSRKTKK